jgi:hypothetical protein
MDMVGKSICGSGETGNKRKATAPAKNTAMTRSVVATGRRMNGSEMFIGQSNCKWQKVTSQDHLPFDFCHLPFEILFSRSAFPSPPV